MRVEDKLSREKRLGLLTNPHSTLSLTLSHLQHPQIKRGWGWGHQALKALKVGELGRGGAGGVGGGGTKL